MVTFYSGEVYNLYKYKKYTDVRLVFAPEFDIAFFGGDPDNFTYPRYDLDITFFRVYENDKPAHIEHYLRWSHDGREGRRSDLCLRTSRVPQAGCTPMAQLEFLRDVRLPLAPGNLQAPHCPAAEVQQPVGGECAHREGRHLQLPEFVQSDHGLPGPD